MSVDAQHPEYRKYIKVWNRIEAAVEGSRAIKQGKTMFLPKPNQDLDGEAYYGSPIQTENDVRYKQYLERAVYTNFCGRTLAGLKGAAFRKYPLIELAPGLEYLEDAATSEGISLVQLSKDAVSEVLKKGRAAMLVDYPSVEEGLTAEQVTRMDLKARIAFYAPETIINWKMEGMNGRSLLTLCVLKENYNKSADEFEYDEDIQYRVLRLDEIGYSQQLYRDDKPYTERFYPRQPDGRPFDYIPLAFIGSTNNDATTDTPPMEAMAEVNIAHYRNSADVEENSFIHGQLTLGVTSDLSAEQWKEMNPAGIVVGARAGHFLGSNGGFHSVQANASSLTKDLMTEKEHQLVMIGAQLITDKNSNQTAKAAMIQHASEHSVLADVCNNVSEAIELCIDWCGAYMGVQGENKYEINTQFFDDSVDPQMIIQSIAMYDRELITSGDVQNYARKAGILPEDRSNDDIDNDMGDVIEVEFGDIEEPEIATQEPSMPDESGEGSSQAEDQGLQAPEKLLNGAQVSSIIDIIEAHSNGSLSDPSAIELLITAFGVSEEKAKIMLGITNG